MWTPQDLPLSVEIDGVKFTVTFEVLEDDSQTEPALPVVMLDAPVHTDAQPHCCDSTCPCHAEQGQEDAR